MDNITFNDLPKAVSALISLVTQQRQEISNLSAAINEIKQKINGDGGNSNLILGKFRRGEAIRLNDPRLWENKTPFESKDAVYYAKQKGCPFIAPEGTKTYIIKAENLADWLFNAPLRKKLKNIGLDIK